MKVLVFLLVLANLLFYAYSAGHFGRPGNPDAERLAQQVAPEKMRLVSNGEAPAVKPKPAEPPAPAEGEAAAPTAEAAAATEQAPAAAAASASSAAPVPPPVEKLCLRWEHLATADAARLASRLEDKFAGLKQVKRVEPGEGGSWWVHIPPLAGKDDAERKAGELRQLGVTDYFIVHEAGSNRNAISLGLFSTEKGGQDRLTELKGKGVRSARLVLRPGKDSLTTVEASGTAPARQAVLEAAAAVLPKAPATDCK